MFLVINHPLILADAEFFCSFEDAGCNNLDIQSVSGGATWAQKSGNSGTYGTGPNDGHDGTGYVYVESSNIAEGSQAT